LTEVDTRLPDNLRKAVAGIHLALGLVFLVVGAAVALGAAWVVYQLIEDPGRIALVSQVLNADATQLRGLRGTFDGKPLEIELGEPVFWLLALFIGAIVLGIVAGIAKSLIAAGVNLLRAF
jgi:ABC-type multidrug transport system fused ATPase/permease subunit